MAPKKRGRPRLVVENDRAPSPAAAPRAAAPKRTRPFRTPQTPFEAAETTEEVDGEPLYTVNYIKNVRFVKGVRQYEVVWEGYNERDTTWEPMENLMGCAAEIRQYEQGRMAEDEAAKEELLRKRQELKEAKERELAELRERAAAAALGDMNGGEQRGEAQQAEAVEEEGGILKKHSKKTGNIWSVFDLTKENPSCKCKTDKGGICGEVPSGTAGTTNYWTHLYAHHRVVWFQLKNADGKLKPAGQAEMKKLMEEVCKGSSTSYSAAVGGEFLSAKLPPSVKETMDRLTSEWIVDEDQPLNAASTPGFRRMMSAATSGRYDGCADTMVKQHVTVMAAEGRQEVTDFHAELRERGLKPAASGDLWSKNKTALFGLVSHGIRRTRVVDAYGVAKRKWVMVEKLCGSVPCKEKRHTGEHIGELSDAAWAGSGLENPIEDIFVRVSDNGTNMIKGWEEGFQARTSARLISIACPCSDLLPADLSGAFVCTLIVQSPCLDHTLELSVKHYTDYPEVQNTIAKGRGMVGYFNSSIVGTNLEDCGLSACQKTAGVPENSLTQDVKTRWRSTHDMCNSLRINQEALLLYDVRNRRAAKGFTDNRFSLADWEVNNQTVAVLAPLANASKYLEGKKYPTSNLILPTIMGCLQLMKEDTAVRRPWNGERIAAAELRPEVQQARKKLYADLFDRWVKNLPESRKRLYFIATLCDPRQKSLRFPGVSAQERETALDWFEAEYLSFYAAKDPAVARTAAARATAGPSAVSRAVHAQHAASSFLDFMMDVSCATEGNPDSSGAEQDLQNQPVEVAVENEARRFLNLPDAPMTTDVLEWWAAHEDNFPNLAVMAQQYLGVPATSASAERLFSVAGRVYDDLRQAMNDDVLESIMWAKINSEKRRA